MGLAYEFGNPYSGGLLPQMEEPLDGRLVVLYKTDLTTDSTFAKYHGMLVAVVADTVQNNGLYMLGQHIDTNYQEFYPANPNGWKKIGDGEGNTIVWDNESIVGDGTLLSPLKVGVVDAGNF
jgi:hypothetical protein